MAIESGMCNEGTSHIGWNMKITTKNSHDTAYCWIWRIERLRSLCVHRYRLLFRRLESILNFQYILLCFILLPSFSPLRVSCRGVSMYSNCELHFFYPHIIHHIIIINESTVFRAQLSILPSISMCVFLNTWKFYIVRVFLLVSLWPRISISLYRNCTSSKLIFIFFSLFLTLCRCHLSELIWRKQFIWCACIVVRIRSPSKHLACKGDAIATMMHTGRRRELNCALNFVLHIRCCSYYYTFVLCFRSQARRKKMQYTRPNGKLLDWQFIHSSSSSALLQFSCHFWIAVGSLTHLSLILFISFEARRPTRPRQKHNLCWRHQWYCMKGKK